MDIDRSAPVTASAEAFLDAPLERIWSLQADIDGWSRWNPDVTHSRLDGPLEAGSGFQWKAGGMSIYSILWEVVPRRRLVWTGRSMGIKAIHVWTFEETDHGVLVRTEESFSGPLARLFAGTLRKMLAKSLTNALEALKAESRQEHHAFTSLRTAG